MTKAIEALLHDIASGTGTDWSTRAAALLAQVARPKARKADVTPVDTSTMTLAEVCAYYKRIAPREDVLFPIRHGLRMSDDLRAAHLALADSGQPGAELRRQLATLQAQWRQARLSEQRANNEPAIGTVEWRNMLPEQQQFTQSYLGAALTEDAAVA